MLGKKAKTLIQELIESDLGRDRAHTVKLVAERFKKMSTKT